MYNIAPTIEVHNSFIEDENVCRMIPVGLNCKYCSDLIIVLTYQLHKESESQWKTGLIDILKIKNFKEIASLSKYKLSYGILNGEIANILTNSDECRIFLSVSTSNGKFCIIRITLKHNLTGSSENEECNIGFEFQEESSILLSDSDVILNHRINETNSRAICGSNSGKLFYLDYEKQTILSIIHNWKGHEFDIWSLLINLENPFLIYSGSDDCLLKLWDTRTPDEPSILFQNKDHEAGITIIGQFAENEHLITTGSYDGNIKIWDIRTIKNKNGFIFHKKIADQVWDIKYINHHKSIISAYACMYDKFVVQKFQFDGATETMEWETKFEEHNSIGYCIVPLFGDPQSQILPFISGSFYDNLIKLWSINS